MAAQHDSLQDLESIRDLYWSQISVDHLHNTVITVLHLFKNKLKEQWIDNESLIDSIDCRGKILHRTQTDQTHDATDKKTKVTVAVFHSPQKLVSTTRTRCN
ncbi:hypothetical protein BGZ83_011488 [Gryganskiella cystojenkinii]|nr:hypothetical protein BGZ83_011488 [Gryganskiella cystojenkinii]